MRRMFMAAVSSKMVAAMALFFLTAVTQAHGQSAFKIRQIVVDLVDNPLVPYTSNPMPRLPRPPVIGQSRWVRIETQYDSSPEWADDVRLEYHVSATDSQQSIVLTGQESYINVARGSGHLAVMFLHPRTVQRYLNGQAPKRVTVLISYQNGLMDGQSFPPSNTRWWEQLTARTGLLLSRMQTPWAVLDNDRYEAIKPAP